MTSIMDDDSFDEVIANMDMPEDPGPSTSSRSNEIHASEANLENNAANKEVTGSNLAVTGSKNAIQVNPNQRGNPLLKAINSVSWEFNENIIPDYVIGAHGE